MATFKAKKFREALKKARNVGRYEEAVTIDGCNLVLQTLTSSQHEEIFSDLGTDTYNTQFQLANLCRSIVEIEGQDLRDVEYIEDDAPAGAWVLNVAIGSEAKAKDLYSRLRSEGLEPTLVAPTEERTIVLEKHDWLMRQLSTWSREATVVGFKKVLEVIAKGEIQANQDVKFTLMGEDSEEKFRRLLGELKEIESSLPSELVSNTLSDFGYLQKSTTVELDQIAKEVSQISHPFERNGRLPDPSKIPVQDEPSEFVVRPSTPVPINPLPTPPPAEGYPSDVGEMMGSRVPMTNPTNLPPQFSKDVLERSNSERARQIAELEGMSLPSPDKTTVHRMSETATLTRNVSHVDEEVAKTILDKPPSSGLNPKYRRHNV